MSILTVEGSVSSAHLPPALGLDLPSQVTTQHRRRVRLCWPYPAPLTGDIHLPQLLPSNSTDAAEQPLYHLEHPEQDGLEDLNDRKRAAFKASKHPGVSWHRQKQQWRAQLKHGKQTHTVGYYETEEEAAQAHDQAKAEAKASGAPPIDEARASSTDKGPVGASYSKVKNKWRAQIMRNNRNRHLGYFETKEEALAVYEAARKEGIFPESRRQGVLDPRPQPPDGNVLATSEGRIKSAYQGVTWNKQKGKWQTRICSGGKRRNLGYFASDKEAHEAYMKAKEADNEIRRQQQQQGQAGGTAEGLPLPELPNQDPDVVRDVNTMLVDEPPTQPLYNNMSAPGAAHYTDPSDHPSLPAQAAHYGSGDVPLPTATQHYSAADSEPAAGHYNDDQQQQQQQQLSSRGMQYTAANGTPPPMSRGQYGAVSSSHQSLPGREDASTHQLEESYLNPAVYADAHNAYQGGVAYAGQQAAQPAYSSHQQDDHQADVQHPYAQLSTSHMSGRLADGQTQMEHEHMPST
ncbi:hypothetical protein WJX72_010170 [[Myrmecia] bisecta]|uniref:AP2/ERF domain-containing protein n=1 Tax=[Myrmecia] bisecta TaxID=41462 RepID=A0AAW1PAL6_9CHLO